MKGITFDTTRDDANIGHPNYGAYGHTSVSSESTRTCYVGEILEMAFGGYVLGNRIYLPWLRRFLAPDPASPFDIGGLNRYAYCVGDPINRIDPSGNASFGWLGKLLGNLMGTIGSAAHTVAQATPTTALTTISQAAETVAVAVGIGAVAAAALDDTQTAGILGWIAAGSGVAGLGLGVAGQAFGKTMGADRASGGRTLLRSGDAGMRSGVSRGASHHEGYKPGEAWVPIGFTKDTYVNGPTKVHAHQGAGVVNVSKFQKTMSYDSVLDDHIIDPTWRTYGNAAGGMNHVADTVIHAAHVEILARAIPRDGKPIVLLSGGHGNPAGRNWSRSGTRDSGESNFYFEDLQMKSRIATATRRQRNEITIENLPFVTADRFQQLISQDAHIIHGYCFSAADEKLTQALGIRSVNTYYI